MSLYSVMLVDDEEEVIQIIIKKLDWASMGFQIVGYAHNGAEALELADYGNAASFTSGFNPSPK